MNYRCVEFTPKLSLKQQALSAVSLDLESERCLAEFTSGSGSRVAVCYLCCVHTDPSGTLWGSGHKGCESHEVRVRVGHPEDQLS